MFILRWCCKDSDEWIEISLESVVSLTYVLVACGLSMEFRYSKFRVLMLDTIGIPGFPDLCIFGRR